MEKYNPNEALSPEKLQTLVNYQIGQQGEELLFIERTERDFLFLFKHFPLEVQEQFDIDFARVGLDDLITQAINKARSLSGGNTYGRTINMVKTGDGVLKPDFSQESYYKILLQKFEELRKFCGL